MKIFKSLSDKKKRVLLEHAQLDDVRDILLASGSELT